MGTNFYFKRKREEIHIGKRSAAGLYCWDCGITLCKNGEEAIHYDASADKWYKQCPKCKKRPIVEDLTSSSAGRELGFNKNSYEKKVGVTSCSSFRWAINKEDIKHIRYIYNEYGEKFTKKEFNSILEECPVQYTDFIGREFS